MGCALVTHNERDFKLLQRAWRLWPAPVRHAGVLVIPQQRWTPSQTAEEMDRFVQSGQPLANELYWWTVGRGWVRFERLAPAMAPQRASRACTWPGWNRWSAAVQSDFPDRSVDLDIVRVTPSRPVDPVGEAVYLRRRGWCDVPAEAPSPGG